MDEDNKIVLMSSLDVKDLPTFEEFKRLGSLDASDKSVWDKFADKYDNIPLSFRFLKNFDPTGVIGYFADGLSEIRAKRNEEKLLKTIYELVKAVCFINQKLGRIDPQYLESQVIALTEMYFDHSMRSYQLEKIEIFRNILMGGIIDHNRDLNEKENIFNMISSLTIDQICIIKAICNNNSIEELKINYSGKEIIIRPVDKETIARELSLAEPYVQQLCLDLIGKGLLIGDQLSDPIGGIDGYRKYYISKYLEHMIKYINGPDK